MFSTLLALALHLPAVGPASAPRSDTPAWTPIIAFDEVRIDADTARVVGNGPYTMWLRWSLFDRAASPQSWDAGVRGSLDLVEVDCTRGATRTFVSRAYQADGTAVASASFDTPAAEWRVSKAESIGGMITAQVCGLAKSRKH